MGQAQDDDGTELDEGVRYSDANAQQRGEMRAELVLITCVKLEKEGIEISPAMLVSFCFWCRFSIDRRISSTNQSKTFIPSPCLRPPAHRPRLQHHQQCPAHTPGHTRGNTVRP